MKTFRIAATTITLLLAASPVLAAEKIISLDASSLAKFAGWSERGVARTFDGSLRRDSWLPRNGVSELASVPPQPQQIDQQYALIASSDYAPESTNLLPASFSGANSGVTAQHAAEVDMNALDQGSKSEPALYSLILIGLGLLGLSARKPKSDKFSA